MEHSNCDLWIFLLSLAVISLTFLCIKQRDEKVDAKGSCNHKWDSGVKVDHYDISFGKKSFLYTTVRCRCEFCGEPRAFKLKG